MAIKYVEPIKNVKDQDGDEGLNFEDENLVRGLEVIMGQKSWFSHHRCYRKEKGGGKVLIWYWKWMVRKVKGIKLRR